jgi:hypothetical protein
MQNRKNLPRKTTLSDKLEHLEKTLSPKLYILASHYYETHEDKNLDTETFSKLIQRIEEVQKDSTVYPLKELLTSGEKKIIKEYSTQKRKVSEISNSTEEQKPKKMKGIQTFPVSSTTSLNENGPFCEGGDSIMVETLKSHFFEFILKPDSFLTQIREFHSFEVQKKYLNLLVKSVANTNVSNFEKLKTFLLEHYLKKVDETEFIEIVAQKKKKYLISRNLNYFIVDLVYERNGSEEMALKELFQRWKQGNVEYFQELNDLVSKDKEFLDQKISEIDESIKNGEIKKYFEMAKEYVQMISGDATNFFEMYLMWKNFQ